MNALFYADDADFFDMAGLRGLARQEVEASSLIRRAACGEMRAAQALHIGYWPFVHEFEIAIDQNASMLPRHQLVVKFGERKVRHVLLTAARAMREMKKEEHVHSLHWLKDAQNLGLTALDRDTTAAGVESLVQSAYNERRVDFFAVLAGTEFIAEELSRFLTSSPAYVDLFARKRWVWGDVHLIPHDHGPSHLETDLDFARAYASDSRAESIEALVRTTIHLFGRAAMDVEDIFLPQYEIAAK